MRLRPDLLLFACLLISMSGCGGGGGIRTYGPGQSMQAGVLQASQARSIELQDRLLKMNASSPILHYTDYKVGPEDALQITFLGSGASNGTSMVTPVGGQTAASPQLGGLPGQLSGVFRVDGLGVIRLMLVGNVKVAGLTPVEIAQKLSMLYQSEGYLVDPQITVSVAEYKHSEVTVSGAVKTPNYYPLIGPRSLLAVLGMAGGLTDQAGDTVTIIRPRPGAARPAGYDGLNAQTISIDLNRLILQGDTSLDIPIDNGDVVFVPFAQSAYVIGAVTKPGNVLLQDNMTLTRAISKCLGKQIDLASNYVTVLRVGNDGRREVIPVDLSKVLSGKESDVLLKPNDIVYVHESKIRRFFYDFKNMLPGSIGLTPTY